MSARQSHEMLQALNAYRKGETNVYRLAKRYGLYPSSIYKALKKAKK